MQIKSTKFIKLSTYSVLVRYLPCIINNSIKSSWIVSVNICKREKYKIFQRAISVFRWRLCNTWLVYSWTYSFWVIFVSIKFTKRSWNLSPKEWGCKLRFFGIKMELWIFYRKYKKICLRFKKTNSNFTNRN